MKQGCIIYVVGDQPLDRTAIGRLLAENGLDTVEHRLCGARPLPSIYRAYRELQQRQVRDIACISVRYDHEAGRYVFLERALSLDSFADLAVLCSPEELAC